MAKKQKYYVVWKGKKPGIYKSWEECKQMISGVKNAQYKSFLTMAEAQKAFENPYQAYRGKKKTPSLSTADLMKIGEIDFNSIAVDAASSGNPGIMEYRGVDTKTRKQLFHVGPFPQGTNNIGEFLAIVHGLAFLDLHQSKRIIYSDSKIAIGWVHKKKCRTNLKPNAKNSKLFELIHRAEKWLQTHSFQTPIVKWETMAWGEIPADFGRKK